MKNTTDSLERLPASAGSPAVKCATCGHKWREGQDGEHDCLGVLCMENLRLRAKVLEQRQYLRAANRGAQRSALVAQLLAARNVKLYQEFKERSQGNDKHSNQHEHS